MSRTKKLCLAAICTAFCTVLPYVFHLFGSGQMFSPMHIPVLLAGILCGPVYGALCGLCGPIISSLITSMPMPPMLISMIPELMVYGLVSGAIFEALRGKKILLRTYIALIIAMIAGRVVGGVVSACVHISKAESYSFAIWAASYITGALPGIIVHLIALPAIVLILKKTGVFNEQTGNSQVL